jgi:RNA polymerase sigma factor for flagellar operon FliA
MSALWQEFERTRSEDVRNRLIEHYLPQVRATAERLKAKLPESVDINDLCSAGILGLMDAVNKFEPDRGNRFETYCSLRIRGAILDDLRQSDWVPRLVRNKAQRLTRAIDDLRVELDREPADDEIAERLNMPVGEFRDLQREVGEITMQVSLENRWNQSGNSGDPRRDMQPLEMLEDKRQQDPLRWLQRQEVRDLAVRGLSEKERIVINMYYFDCITMKEIGEYLGLSESRVCQIHTQAVKHLKSKFDQMQEDMSSIE